MQPPPLEDQSARTSALDPTRSFIVQAPAGSGKTGLLVRRFLLLLASVSQPEEILAITFTRKATAEMSARILAALRAAETPGDLDADPQIHALAQQALAHDRKQQWHLLENPQRLKIETIDAFGFELVRNMPWSSGFGATPDILAEHQSMAFYREAAQRTLGHLEQGPPRADYCATVLRLVDVQFARAQQLLATMLEKREHWLRVLRRTPIARANYEAMWQAVITQELATLTHLIPAPVQASVVALARFAAQNLRATDPAHPLVACVDLSAWPPTQVETLAVWRGLATLLLTGQQTLRKQVNKNLGFPATAKPEKQQFHECIAMLDAIPDRAAQLARITLLPDGEFSDSQWQLLESLLHLLPLAAAELQLLFKEDNCCDYSEISLRAERALGEADVPSTLALSLDYRLSHILMDEVQDTAKGQLELVRKLTEGWHPGDGRTLFFVGDPMQSIYRFREAEVANFLTIQQQGIGTVQPTRLVLQTNFRSAPALVEWYNRVFADIFPDHNEITRAAIQYAPSLARPQDAHTAEVQFHAHIDGTADSEATTICAAITAHLHRDPTLTIGVLARYRSHLYALATTLRQHGIPYQAVELEPLSTRPAIQDLLALTRALLQPADRIAWLAILRAPWCGLTLPDLSLLASDARTLLELANDATVVARLSDDGQARLRRLLTQLTIPLTKRGRNSLRQVVTAAWLQLAGPCCLSATQLADCETYLALLDDLTRQYPLLTAATLQAAVARLWSDTAVACPVQLLTIHKAKGLEFDVVILPQLHRRPRNPDPQLLRWAHLPEQLLVAGLGHRRAGQDLFTDYLKNLEHDRQHNETIRLLYVACTRARRWLHLSMNLTTAENGRDDGQCKPPARGSLLHHLWPAIQSELHPTPATTAPAAPPPAVPALARLPVAWRSTVLEELTASPTTATADLAPRADPEVHHNDAARMTGIALHQLLEQIHGDDWRAHLARDADRFIATSRATLLEAGIIGPPLARALKQLTTALAQLQTDTRAEWIFSPKHTNIECEWAVTGHLDGVATNIIIDRSFVDADGLRWIIDFKSSQPQRGSLATFIAKERNQYQSQLDHYATIIAQLEPRPATHIRLGLYFPMCRGWCEWAAAVGRE